MAINRTVVRRGTLAAIEEIEKDGEKRWLVRCSDFALDRVFASRVEAETRWETVESGLSAD
jgi:hypothetical protein